MKRRFALPLVVAAIACAAVFAQTQTKGAPATPVVPNPTFEQIKALAGEWQGKVGDMPATTSFRVVSAGSAVMNVLGEGTEHEMVTMFHLDGRDLMVTHYCAAGNQPRMVARPSSDPKVITFEFKDVTNLSAPDAGHMRRLVLTLVDADHHTEDWTFREAGKDSTGRFVFTRKR